jgi:hypothetical protein
MNVWKQSVHRLYEALQNPHAANRMWLPQFVCAPQFFKTPSGLCGHTVDSHIEMEENGSNEFSKERIAELCNVDDCSAGIDSQRLVLL